MSQGNTGTAKSKTKSPDALALLTADHELVQDLFDKFEKARTDKQKADLAEQICTELTIHAQIEEEIFYPAVREAIDDEDLMDEADVEHACGEGPDSADRGVRSRRRPFRCESHRARRVRQAPRRGRTVGDVPEDPEGRA